MWNKDLNTSGRLSDKVGLAIRNIYFILTNFRLIEKQSIANHIREEYAEQLNAIKNTGRSAWKTAYASSYDIRKNSCLTIYDIIRRKKPNVVLETGVANGFSTRMILAALNKNKKGILYSVEISKDVGKFVNGINKKRWKLIVGKPDTIFSNALRKIRKVDIFLHDSDHSYNQMKKEFNQVKNKMTKGGIIMSDDIDVNNAFMEFAKEMKKKPRIIPNIRRCFGYFEL